MSRAWLRPALLTAWLVVAAVVALHELDPFYPVRHWLIFTYLGIWAAALLWSLGCAGMGLRLVRRLGIEAPFRERLLYGGALGIFAYALAMFVLGIVHGLSAVTFFALPLAGIAIGFDDLRRAGAGLKRLVPVGLRGPPGVLAVAGLVLGVLGVTALYLDLLTPGNLSYDTRWYHLALAEDYAASGAVRRFGEGSFLGTVPQLATYLYTWAFLLPGAGLFGHVELAAHLEFIVFLATLASLPLLVTWIAGGRRIAASWSALFLFPGIFVYDANLNGGADHILAFWTIPFVLALRRFWRTPDRRWAALVAILASAGMMTKYQAMYVVLPGAALFLARSASLAVRASAPAARREARLALGIAAAIAVAATAPMWLKNWIWYGNPVFPFAHERFATHPWSADARTSRDYLDARWVSPAQGLARVGETIVESLRFGFRAHDWAEFHGIWPVTGFLFNLLWPVPLFLAKAARLRMVSLLTLLGVGIWYFTFHQDRYLQVLTPLMAACVLVTINRLWQMQVPVRVGVGLVLFVQLAWGANHPFLPSHAMLGQAALKHTIDFLGSGFSSAGQLEGRFAVDPGLEAAGALTPRGARVLIHGQHLRLGIGRAGATDVIEQQSAFAYRMWSSPREVLENLRTIGVTDIVWTPVPALWTDWGSELGFFDFVTHYAVDRRAAGGYFVAHVPEELPAWPADATVDLRLCRGRGQIPMSALNDVMAGAPVSGGAPPGAPRFVVTESACAPDLGDPYVALTGAAGFRLWSRSLARPTPAPAP